MSFYPKRINEILLYADGGSRGNPGSATAAYLITDVVGTVLKSSKKCIGVYTNNEACALR